MTDTTVAAPPAQEPVASTIRAQAEPSAAGQLPWWGFTAATIGRPWPALVTGMMLIATLPAVLLPGWEAHVVVSGSMEPRINIGDVVISQQRTDYQPGQVIVFDDADRGAMTHRLLSTDGEIPTTKGDANPTADSSPVPREDATAWVVLVMFAGLPWVWFHTGQWTPLLAFLLSLLLAAAAVAADRPVTGPSTTGELPSEIPDEANASAAATAPVDSQGPAHPDAPLDSDAALASDAPPASDAMADSDSPRPADPAAVPTADDNPAPSHRPRTPARSRAASLLPPAAVLLLLVPMTDSVLRPASAAFSATTTNAANTWKAAVPAPLTYAHTVLADNPYIYLRLNEVQPGNTASYPAANLGSNTLAQSYARASSGILLGSIRLESPASTNITPTPNTSAEFRRDGACILPNSAQPGLTNPPAITVEAWIRSSGSNGGKIMGLENQTSNTSVSSQYDRHLYQDGDGYVRFGVWTGTTTTVRSATPLNDDQWHHVMGTLNGPNGTLRLYVDGELAGSRANVTAENFTGRWRIGCGNLSGWTGTGAWSGDVPADLTVNQTFIGYIDEPAIYLSALTAADAAERWSLGKP